MTNYPKSEAKSTGALLWGWALGCAALILGLWLGPRVGQSAQGALVPTWPMVLLSLGSVWAGVGVAILMPWGQGSARWARQIVGGAGAVWGVFALLVTLTTSAPVRAGSGLPWEHDYDAALGQARSRGVPMMIDFTAQWCAACHDLEAEVFYDPAGAAKVARGGGAGEGGL